MDQKKLYEKPSWAMTSNPSDETEINQVEQTDEGVPSNYQAMGESYSDTTNFEVNKEPGRL
ncbi:hypothetical protein [Paenibacillus ferrarius]|uniref:hypothetical protein n=1 Tax=Paenibacillus ferrarius TaxID=1469647 RepID=UPI003D26F557